MPALANAVTNRAKILLTLCASGVALPLLVGALPQSATPTLAWILDLATHWQWPYLLAGAVCAGWLLVQKAYRWVLAAVSCISISGFIPMPSATAESHHANQILTIVTANINADNEDLSTLPRWLAQIDADVVVLQELNPRAAAKLEHWHDYPYRSIHAQEGPFGIAILSRFPLENTEMHEPAGHTPQIRTYLTWGNAPLALSAIHPMPPISPEYHLRRSALFTNEASWATASGLPAIIAGDFNASPWSSAMRPLFGAGLRRATTLLPTWPSVFPVIPIDQIIVSGHWRLVDSGVGPDFGSDHRPAFARLSRATD